MPVPDAALVSAGQPPLEQRGDHVDARQDLVCRFRPAFDDGDLVLVAGRRQPGVAVPSVGVNHGAGHYGTLDEGEQVVPGHILDAPFISPFMAESILRHSKIMAWVDADRGVKSIGEF
jgi:hypothetical protein